MNCTECTDLLDDYVDGRTGAGPAAEVAAHLAACPACRQRHASLQALITGAQQLPRDIPPSHDLWLGIEAGIQKPARVVRFPARWLTAAAACLLLVVGGRVAWQRYANAPAFTVTRIEGAPRVAGRSLGADARLKVGQWLETDAGSSALVDVAAIGQVTLQPNSRLRLVTTSPTEHRLELVRGGLEAFVVAPPRLFVIDTPAATAIDLGCAYSIAVDAQGGGVLHVTSGYVALARDGREEIVRAGMMCAMRKGVGAGTPFVADAPAGLRAALDRFDFEKTGGLSEVLAQVRPEDALTLWHLLGRVPAGQRGTVFAALAAIVAPPDGVTREGILAGDRAMLENWNQALIGRQAERTLDHKVKIKKG
jgi:hypothetical protein